RGARRLRAPCKPCVGPGRASKDPLAAAARKRKHSRMKIFALACASVLALAGCFADDGPMGPPAAAGSPRAPGPSGTVCADGEELFRGACVDPAHRYEPAARVDEGNVVDYGVTLQSLVLPDPPKSGFRIVVPPRTMMPGEEEEYCVSWQFPSIKNTVVYA